METLALALYSLGFLLLLSIFFHSNLLTLVVKQNSAGFVLQGRVLKAEVPGFESQVSNFPLSLFPLCASPTLNKLLDSFKVCKLDHITHLLKTSSKLPVAFSRRSKLLALTVRTLPGTCLFSYHPHTLFILQPHMLSFCPADNTHCVPTLTPARPSA